MHGARNPKLKPRFFFEVNGPPSRLRLARFALSC